MFHYKGAQSKECGTEKQALTHCYKFLGRSGVNGNSLVKVCFGSTHFNRHGKALKHLITAQALHVQSHHLQKEEKKEKYTYL